LIGQHCWADFQGRIGVRFVSTRAFCRLSPVLEASEPMQKVIQHLMGSLKNHLSSEDNAYLRQVGAPESH
jgi:hypothetical protein